MGKSLFFGKRIFFAAAVAVSLTVVAASCGGEKNGGLTAPSPSASDQPSASGEASGSSEPAAKVTSSAPESVGSGAASGEVSTPRVIAFPPRDQPNAFFQDLTIFYRDILRRPPASVTYVDPEGENVWLTEYFRFYLNGCPHTEAMIRTLREIISGGGQPVCGNETPSFPPRNLPNEFQIQLELTYRDVLRRGAILSYVDSEGANVWLAQYLRFRLTGCDHLTAEGKVFAEIRGGGVQPDCVPGGGGGGGGNTITGTVAALGINRHLITITGGSGTGTLGLGLAWSNPATDLDLYLTFTSCSGYPPLDCNILAASQRNSGTTESLSRAGVRAGDQFYAWVDNFSNRSESYALSTAVALTTTEGLQFTVGPEEPQASKPAGFSKTN